MRKRQYHVFFLITRQPLANGGHGVSRSYHLLSSFIKEPRMRPLSVAMLADSCCTPYGDRTVTVPRCDETMGSCVWQYYGPARAPSAHPSLTMVRHVAIMMTADPLQISRLGNGGDRCRCVFERSTFSLQPKITLFLRGPRVLLETLDREQSAYCR
jgi:hypothetical protein